MHFSSKNTLLIVGGALTAALLAACGGGGSGATTPSPHVAPSSALPTQSTPTSGTRITFTIPAKSKHAQQRNGSSQARAAVAAKRTPKFVSGSTLGMQISVTSGTTTNTVYADTSASGGNCTTADPNTGAQTCSVIVPTAGATETIAVTTVDQAPTSDTNGYGTGFPGNANVLGVGSSNVNATIGGITNASVTVMLVVTDYYEAGASGNSAALYTDGGYFYPNINNPVTRFVVQAGTANSWNVISSEQDADNNYPASYPTTSTLIDVNGSPAPISLTSSSTGLTLSTYAGSNTGNPPSTPSGTITIPDTSYFGAYSSLVIGVNYDGMAAPGSTITYSNGLTALNPYSGVSQAVTAQYVLAPITVTSGTTATVTQNQTTTVTVSDWGATNGLYPKDNLGVVATSGSANCYNTNALPNGIHDVVATITPGALPTGPPWTQSFTVTGANTSGPCTFSLVDADSYNAGSSVSSQTISLEVLGN
jgi:hypothetical protein